ncbi:MAG: sensor histidine kinase [Bacteroidia bacterium]|nr:sensor histidine kinase [Bacteroidia bacterium]
MKTNSLSTLTRLLALITFVLVGVGMYLGNHTLLNTLSPTVQIILVAGLIAIVVYSISAFLLRSIVKQKLSVLYKLIRSTSLDEKTAQENKSTDELFVNAEADIESWKKRKAKEILQQEILKNYRRDFTGNISHELKTPLFNIEGYIHTLLEGAMNQPILAKKYLKKAAKNVDRLSAILEDLSIISKFESDQLEVVNESFDIKELCQECLEELDYMIQDKKSTVIIDSGNEEPILVLGDPKLLRAVISNLLSNSIRYGKKKGTTRLDFTPIANTWLIEVIDDGIGIKEEHLPHLFNRFYRVDFSRSRKEGGSGIGLAIVKHIIDAHSQSVNVTSEFGKGSNFSFTLEKGVS